MYAAFTGWAPEFAQEPVAATLNGYELVAALVGRYDNVGGIFEGMNVDFATAVAATGRAATNYVDWSNFTVTDVVNVFREFAGDVGFWLRLNAMALRDDWLNGTAISWRSMVLVYCSDPTLAIPWPTDGTPGSIPTTDWTPPPVPTGPVGTVPPPPNVTPVPTLGTPPPTPTPGTPSTPIPTATPGRCAAPTIRRSGPATILFEKLEPPNPVVVGQDESRRGVDLHLRIVSPAVVYAYERYQVVSSETRCCHVEGTCEDEDYEGCQYDWEGWATRTVYQWGCVPYRETYADPVDLGTLRVRAILTAASRAWISGELALKYPGARVRHGDWEILPQDGWAEHDVIGGDQVYTLDATVAHIPFEDPGVYEMLVSGRTTGTPYTPAVYFGRDGGTFDVSLIETALIR